MSNTAPRVKAGLRRLAVYALLVVALLVGMFLAEVYGPASSLPVFAKLDEQYLKTMRNHYLLLGFAGALAASAINVVLRIAHGRVLLTTVFVATVVFLGLESTEPGFSSYLVPALADFLLWILVAAAPVVAVFWLVESRLRSGRNSSAGQASSK